MEKCFYAHPTVQVVWDSSARGVSGGTSYPLKNHVSIYPVKYPVFWEVALRRREGGCLGSVSGILSSDILGYVLCVLCYVFWVMCSGLGRFFIPWGRRSVPWVPRGSPPLPTRERGNTSTTCWFRFKVPLSSTVHPQGGGAEERRRGLRPEAKAGRMDGVPQKGGGRAPAERGGRRGAENSHPHQDMVVVRGQEGSPSSHIMLPRS
jgi:hypothetical protein